MQTQINWHNLITTLGLLLAGLVLIFHGNQQEGLGLLMGALGVASPGMPVSKPVVPQSVASIVEPVPAPATPAKP